MCHLVSSSSGLDRASMHCVKFMKFVFFSPQISIKSASGNNSCPTHGHCINAICSFSCECYRGYHGNLEYIRAMNTLTALIPRALISVPVMSVSVTMKFPART